MENGLGEHKSAVGFALFCPADVSGLQPPCSYSPFLWDIQQKLQYQPSSKGHRESAGSQNTAAPRAAAVAACSPPHESLQPTIPSGIRLPVPPSPFCDQLAHSLQKGLCLWIKLLTSCYHFSGCIQNQKIQEIYSQMFPCLFVDSV